MPGPVKPIPDAYPGATPYLICRDAAKAIEFYKQAFGATERSRLDMPGGKIGHAELMIGKAVIMLADEFPEMGARSPQTIGGSPVSVLVYVEDVDSFAKRAETAGVKILRPLADQFYGDRSVHLEDPFGHRWGFATHVEDVPPEEVKRRAESMFGKC